MQSRIEEIIQNQSEIFSIWKDQSNTWTGKFEAESGLMFSLLYSCEYKRKKIQSCKR